MKTKREICERCKWWNVVKENRDDFNEVFFGDEGGLWFYPAPNRDLVTICGVGELECNYKLELEFAK